MTPDELKNNWKNISSAPAADSREPLPDPMLDRIIFASVSSTRDRMAARYFRVALTVAPLGIVSTLIQDRLLPVGAVIFICIFFLIAGGMDFYLGRALRRLDLTRMGVDQVASTARKLRRLHWIFQGVLIPLAAVVLFFYFRAYAGDEGMVMAMAVGGGVGLIIGLILWLRFMRDYRSIIR